MLLIAIVLLSLVACGPGDYDGKIVNNSIVTDAKVTGLERAPYRASACKVHTDKGEFMMYVAHAEYFEQLHDFYNLKQNTGKDLILDIVYINNIKVDNETYEIKTIVIKE